MSLDVDGFTKDIEGGEVMIRVSSDHRLLKLARNLPWDEMLEVILPDLKRTEKKMLVAETAHTSAYPFGRLYFTADV
ncbi:MAG: hypothetical protein EBY22_15250 [Gammaproteobacteria bacterium]|nr:hypothetical protein [Gammaproteobacteria bacterium]